jgi:hypothetical protein
MLGWLSGKSRSRRLIPALLQSKLSPLFKAPCTFQPGLVNFWTSLALRRTSEIETLLRWPTWVVRCWLPSRCARLPSAGSRHSLGVVRPFAAAAIKKLRAQEAAFKCVFSFSAGGCRVKSIWFSRIGPAEEICFCFFQCGRGRAPGRRSSRQHRSSFLGQIPPCQSSSPRLFARVHSRLFTWKIRERAPKHAPQRRLPMFISLPAMTESK